MAKETNGGPSPELDLADELRLNPLREVAGDVSGRAAARERRRRALERVQLLPQLPRRAGREPGTGPADMGQLAVTVLREDQRADGAG